MFKQQADGRSLCVSGFIIIYVEQLFRVYQCITSTEQYCLNYPATKPTIIVNIKQKTTVWTVFFQNKKQMTYHLFSFYGIQQ